MIPKDFENRMREYLGDDFDRFFESLEKGSIQALRVNTKYMDPEVFAQKSGFNCERIPFACDGYYTSIEKPGHLPWHHAGIIYMQDPSAMATVHVLNFKKGWKVLDSCASPGGKSTQISSYIGQEGILVSCEYVSKRCKILQGNIERMGCDNAVILNVDTEELGRTYPDTFDVVLADVPCSGEGMFRKNDMAQSEWSLDAVSMCANRQREILENIYSTVKPGGYLIYSTCTFSLEENEMNVDAFLDRHEDFELYPINESVRKYTVKGINYKGARHDLSLCARFYPHVSKGEGQFIALLRRKEDFHDCRSKHALDKIQTLSNEDAKELAVAKEFLEDNLISIPDNLTLFKYNGYIYLKPDINLPKYGVYCVGVCVGEVQKGRLLPHHHLFSALGHLFKRKLILDICDKRVKAYIHGESISVNDDEVSDGWGVVCIENAPVGGIKTSRGICKNHYPKGLRE